MMAQRRKRKTRFQEGDRVVIPGTGEHATVDEVQPLAEGPWAEQYYSLRLDGNDLCCVNMHEVALVSESEYPDWDEADYVDEQGQPVEPGQ